MHTSKAGQFQMWQANYSDCMSLFCLPEPQLIIKIKLAASRNATGTLLLICSDKLCKRKHLKGQELSLLSLTPAKSSLLEFYAHIRYAVEGRRDAT